MDLRTCPRHSWGFSPAIILGSEWSRWPDRSKNVCNTADKKMSNEKPGAGQTALVTGASMGIGVDLAECFAKDGYDLILAARSAAALQEAAERLSKTYAIKANVFTVDLAERGGGTRLAEAIKAAGLEVDVLVNNAGFGKAGPFAGSNIDLQLGMIDLNDRALVELTQIYWAQMLTRKRGGVLDVA